MSKLIASLILILMLGGCVITPYESDYANIPYYEPYYYYYGPTLTMIIPNTVYAYGWHGYGYYHNSPGHYWSNGVHHQWNGPSPGTHYAPRRIK